MDERVSEFVVEGWEVSGSTVSLHARRDDDRFVETIRFPVDLTPTPPIERLLDLLSVIAGVSDVKACAPASVHHPSVTLTAAGIEAARAVYDEGLREFAVTAGFGLPVPVVYHGGRARPDAHGAVPDSPTTERPMIPLGAGRDSSLVTLALRDLDPLLVTVGHNRFADRIADHLGLELLTIERTISPRLLELNAAGAPNGHVPVTAINSLVAVVLAEHLGGLPVVMANERGASSPTRHVDGVAVNHQFSKSHRFEILLQRAIASTGSRVRYGSALRTASEQQIARAFATHGVELHGVFMSCNRAMLRDPARRSAGWCGECPKCRSVYLSLAPFLEPEALTVIFGRDLLDDPAQAAGFIDLVRADAKPFECVAEIDEARHAARAVTASPRWSRHPVVTALASALGDADDTVGPPAGGEPDEHHASDRSPPVDGLPIDLVERVRQVLDA